MKKKSLFIIGGSLFISLLAFAASTQSFGFDKIRGTCNVIANFGEGCLAHCPKCFWEYRSEGNIVGFGTLTEGECVHCHFKFSQGGAPDGNGNSPDPGHGN